MIKINRRHSIPLILISSLVIGAFVYHILTANQQKLSLLNAKNTISISNEAMGPNNYTRCVSHKIKKNEFIYDILLQSGATPGEIHRFLDLEDAVETFKQVRPGDSIYIFLSSESMISKLVIKKSSFIAHIFEKIRDNQIYSWQWQAPLERREEIVSGTIEDNLYNILLANNENPELASMLADIYSCQIDFFSDIQSGDCFNCLVEKYYFGARFMRYGKIKFANFRNRQRNFTAMAFFSEEEGNWHYYDLEGRSLERFFLKSPLKFGHISSGFTYNRFHPVLKIFRPHLGVDYAAPAGTPVWSTAAGVIIQSGWMGDYGNAVVIRHANGYETLYGHLSRIEDGIVSGVKVAQGEKIGYVGATGLATGAHLDYRIRRHGNYINPLKLNPPSDIFISDSLFEQFRLLAQSYAPLLNNFANK